MTYILIESNDDLDYLDTELTQKEILGIDTEFRRTSKTNLKLALLQIKDLDETYLIDCVKIKAKKESCKFLSCRKVTKIFHSSKEDLEAIFSWTNCQVSNIFDTQLANAFLGNSFSVSYKDLVLQDLEVKIKKDETRSNWLRRPLSSSQLDYAASDVEFLLELYFKQKPLLEDSKKYIFFKEEIGFNSNLSLQKNFEAKELINDYRLKDKGDKVLLKKIEDVVLEVSEQHNINSTLLLSKKNQRKFLKSVRDVGLEESLTLFSNWRKEVLSDSILKILEKEIK